MARKKLKGNKRRLCVYLFKDGCSSWGMSLRISLPWLNILLRVLLRT